MKRVCWKEQEWEKAVFEVRGDNLKSGGHGGDGERQTRGKLIWDVEVVRW